MSAMRDDASWLHGYCPDVKARLVCFPHAGAGASSFIRWKSLFPPEINVLTVQLPGRENVANTAPITSMNVAVNSLLPQILTISDRPFALYGHSMGALLAFEIARSLHNLGVPPCRLFISGRRAPHRHNGRDFLHKLPDEELINVLEEMASYTVSYKMAKMRSYALRVVRADLELCGNYAYQAADKLTCPISAFSSDGDQFVSTDDVMAWADETNADFDLTAFTGDHFFNQQHRAQIAEIITEKFSTSFPT